MAPEKVLFYKGLFSLAYLIIFTMIIFIFDELHFPTIDRVLFSNILGRAFIIKCIIIK